MKYGSVREDARPAHQWLRSRGREFGHFIGGVHTKPKNCFVSRNPADDAILAKLSQATKSDVNRAVSAARKAQPAWYEIGIQRRAYYLHTLAELVREHERLFAVLESLESGTQYQDCCLINTAYAVQTLSDYASLSRVHAKAVGDRMPFGVCGQIIYRSSSFLKLVSHVTPALAAGNTTVVKPDQHGSLTAHLFAEICNHAKLPQGVVNILTGDESVGAAIAHHPNIDRITFTGTESVGSKIRKITAGSGKSASLMVGGKSPFIIFDDADVDSAVQDLAEVAWMRHGRDSRVDTILLIEESVAPCLFDRLRERMDRLIIGNPLDICTEIGAIFDRKHWKSLNKLRDRHRTNRTHVANVSLPLKGCYFPPTLVEDLDASSPLMQEEIAGPILASITFRSLSEAVAIANAFPNCMNATIWTENLNLAFDAAMRLVSRNIGINFSLSSEVNSGLPAMIGGGYPQNIWEELPPFTKPQRTLQKRIAQSSSVPIRERTAEMGDCSAYLYIKGKEETPADGAAYIVYGKNKKVLGCVPIATQKDVARAVAAAQSAIKWSEAAGKVRALQLHRIAVALDHRSADLTRRINTLTGARTGKAEVRKSVDQLLSYAARADKFDGQAQNNWASSLTLTFNEPLGVISTLCSDTSPLLGVITLMAPAIAVGNRVIMIPSEELALAAVEFYQVLDDSGVPPGVVNILTGSHAELALCLAREKDVDAIWNFSSSKVAAKIERECASNPKLVWENGGVAYDWHQTDADEFLRAAIKKKTIKMLYGA